MKRVYSAVVVVTMVVAQVTFVVSEHVTHIRSLKNLSLWRKTHADVPRRLLFVDEAHPPSLYRLFVAEHETADDPTMVTAAVYLTHLKDFPRPGEERIENAAAQSSSQRRRAESSTEDEDDMAAVIEWSPGATHRYPGSSTWVVLISQARPEIAQSWLTRVPKTDKVHTLLYCVVGTTPRCDRMLAGPLGFYPHQHKFGVVVNVQKQQTHTFESLDDLMSLFSV